jgi:aryl-alcohol dehydrogenase-like predicted oxidoreductase
MTKRQLGRSEISIAPLALGGNVFGWTLNEKGSFLILDSFIEAGHNLVDTADVYSVWAPGNQGGESETIIGKWLKKNPAIREKVVIATKLGKPMGPDKKGLSKAYIKKAVHDSLKRLQTEYIDLYQSHEDDPHTPFEESFEGFAELIKEGKIRAIGASNISSKRFLEAIKISKQNGLPRYESLQPLYNLYDRSSFETEMQSLCIENRIGVISYYSLASGFLTGKYRSLTDLSKSARGKGNAKYLNPRGIAILHALDEIAAQYHCSDATIALSWLIQRPGVTAPIASATSIEQLRELIDAAALNLNSEAIHLLDRASAGG